MSHTSVVGMARFRRFLACLARAGVVVAHLDRIWTHHSPFARHRGFRVRPFEPDRAARRRQQPPPWTRSCVRGQFLLDFRGFALGLPFMSSSVAHSLPSLHVQRHVPDGGFSDNQGSLGATRCFPSDMPSQPMSQPHRPAHTHGCRGRCRGESAKRQGRPLARISASRVTQGGQKSFALEGARRGMAMAVR